MYDGTDTLESPPTYLKGDIVWVKLSGYWWPGEVKNEEDMPSDMFSDFKKPPLVIVKFFDEDSYEYVKQWSNIYPYNCEKKSEFIKKGMAGYRAKLSHMAKFPRDIGTAEEKTNGNPNILSQPEFLPAKKINYDEIFGTPSPKKSAKGKVTSANKKSSKDNSEPLITHRRFLGNDDYKAYICIQYPLKDRAPDSDEEEIQKLNRDPEETLICQSCSFKTKRLGVMLMHTKMHLEGIYITTKRKTKKPKDVELTDSETEAAVTKSPKPKQRKKKAEPASKSTDVFTDLLEEWDDTDDEMDNSKTPSKTKKKLAENKDNKTDIAIKDNSESADLQNDKSTSNHTVDSSDVLESPKQGPGKKNTHDDIKNCFDFDEEEEEDDFLFPTSGGRKIPRVIPEKPRASISELLEISQKEDDLAREKVSECTGEPDKNLKESTPAEQLEANVNKKEILRVSQSFNRAPNVDDTIENTFKELMEETELPALEDLTQTLKPEQNFHDARTIKFPDKGGTAVKEGTSPKSGASKKRFVTSFEDFEAGFRKIEDEEKRRLAADKEGKQDKKRKYTPKDDKNSDPQILKQKLILEKTEVVNTVDTLYSERPKKTTKTVSEVVTQNNDSVPRGSIDKRNTRCSDQEKSRDRRMANTSFAEDIAKIEDAILIASKKKSRRRTKQFVIEEDSEKVIESTKEEDHGTIVDDTEKFVNLLDKEAKDKLAAFDAEIEAIKKDLEIPHKVGKRIKDNVRGKSDQAEMSLEQLTRELEGSADSGDFNVVVDSNKSVDKEQLERFSHQKKTKRKTKHADLTEDNSPTKLKLSEEPTSTNKSRRRKSPKEDSRSDPTAKSRRGRSLRLQQEQTISLVEEVAKPTKKNEDIVKCRTDKELKTSISIRKSHSPRHHKKHSGYTSDTRLEINELETKAKSPSRKEVTLQIHSEVEDLKEMTDETHFVEVLSKKEKTTEDVSVKSVVENATILNEPCVPNAEPDMIKPGAVAIPQILTENKEDVIKSPKEQTPKMRRGRSRKISNEETMLSTPETSTATNDAEVTKRSKNKDQTEETTNTSVLGEDHSTATENKLQDSISDIIVPEVLNWNSEYVTEATKAPDSNDRKSEKIGEMPESDLNQTEDTTITTLMTELGNEHIKSSSSEQASLKSLTKVPETPTSKRRRGKTRWNIEENALDAHASRELPHLKLADNVDIVMPAQAPTDSTETCPTNQNLLESENLDSSRGHDKEESATNIDDKRSPKKTEECDESKDTTVKAAMLTRTIDIPQDLDRFLKEETFPKQTELEHTLTSHSATNKPVEIQSFVHEALESFTKESSKAVKEDALQTEKPSDLPLQETKQISDKNQSIETEEFSASIDEESDTPSASKVRRGRPRKSTLEKIADLGTPQRNSISPDTKHSQYMGSSEESDFKGSRRTTRNSSKKEDSTLGENKLKITTTSSEPTEIRVFAHKEQAENKISEESGVSKGVLPESFDTPDKLKLGKTVTGDSDISVQETMLELKQLNADILVSQTVDDFTKTEKPALSGTASKSSSRSERSKKRKLTGDFTEKVVTSDRTETADAKHLDKKHQTRSQTKDKTTFGPSEISMHEFQGQGSKDVLLPTLTEHIQQISKPDEEQNSTNFIENNVQVSSPRKSEVAAVTGIVSDKVYGRKGKDARSGKPKPKSRWDVVLRSECSQTDVSPTISDEVKDSVGKPEDSNLKESFVNEAILLPSSSTTAVELATPDLGNIQTTEVKNILKSEHENSQIHVDTQKDDTLKENATTSQRKKARKSKDYQYGFRRSKREMNRLNIFPSFSEEPELRPNEISELGDVPQNDNQHQIPKTEFVSQLESSSSLEDVCTSESFIRSESTDILQKTIIKRLEDVETKLEIPLLPKPDPTAVSQDNILEGSKEALFATNTQQEIFDGKERQGTIEKISIQEEVDSANVPFEVPSTIAGNEAKTTSDTDVGLITKNSKAPEEVSKEEGMPILLQSSYEKEASKIITKKRKKSRGRRRKYSREKSVSDKLAPIDFVTDKIELTKEVEQISEKTTAESIEDYVEGSIEKCEILTSENDRNIDEAPLDIQKQIDNLEKDINQSMEPETDVSAADLVQPPFDDGKASTIIAKKEDIRVTPRKYSKDKFIADEGTNMVESEENNDQTSLEENVVIKDPVTQIISTSSLAEQSENLILVDDNSQTAISNSEKIETLQPSVVNEQMVCGDTKLPDKTEPETTLGTIIDSAISAVSTLDDKIESDEKMMVPLETSETNDQSIDSLCLHSKADDDQVISEDITLTGPSNETEQQNIEVIVAECLHSKAVDDQVISEDITLSGPLNETEQQSTELIGSECLSKLNEKVDVALDIPADEKKVLLDVQEQVEIPENQISRPTEPQASEPKADDDKVLCSNIDLSESLNQVEEQTKEVDVIDDSALDKSNESTISRQAINKKGRKSKRYFKRKDTKIEDPLNTERVDSSEKETSQSTKLQPLEGSAIDDQMDSINETKQQNKEELNVADFVTSADEPTTSTHILPVTKDKAEEHIETCSEGIDIDAKMETPIVGYVKEISKGHKEFDTLDEQENTVKVASKPKSDEGSKEITVRAKRGRPRKYSRQESTSDHQQEESVRHSTEFVNTDTTNQSELSKKPPTTELPPFEADHSSDITVVGKRERGRPRKHKKEPNLCDNKSHDVLSISAESSLEKLNEPEEVLPAGIKNEPSSDKEKLVPPKKNRWSRLSSTKKESDDEQTSIAKDDVKNEPHKAASEDIVAENNVLELENTEIEKQIEKPDPSFLDAQTSENSAPGFNGNEIILPLKKSKRFNDVSSQFLTDSFSDGRISPERKTDDTLSFPSYDDSFMSTSLRNNIEGLIKEIDSIDNNVIPDNVDISSVDSEIKQFDLPQVKMGLSSEQAFDNYQTSVNLREGLKEEIAKCVPPKKKRIELPKEDPLSATFDQSFQNDLSKTEEKVADIPQAPKKKIQKLFENSQAFGKSEKPTDFPLMSPLAKKKSFLFHQEEFDQLQKADNLLQQKDAKDSQVDKVVDLEKDSIDNAPVDVDEFLNIPNLRKKRKTSLNEEYPLKKGKLEEIETVTMQDDKKTTDCLSDTLISNLTSINTSPDGNLEPQKQLKNEMDGKLNIQTNLSVIATPKSEILSAIATHTSPEVKSEVKKEISGPAANIIVKSESQLAALKDEIVVKQEEIATSLELPVSKVIPNEPELVSISVTPTVMSEQDLADAQVEITPDKVISEKKPSTLGTFSLDFSEPLGRVDVVQTIKGKQKKTTETVGTEFTSKAMLKEFDNRLLTSQPNTYVLKSELLDILEGNSNSSTNSSGSEQKFKTSFDNYDKKSVVQGIIDFEEAIPSQIVLSNKVNPESVLIDSSKLLERLSMSAEASQTLTRKVVIQSNIKVPESLSKSLMSRIAKPIGTPKPGQRIVIKTPRPPVSLASKIGSKPIILSEQIIRPANQTTSVVKQLVQPQGIKRQYEDIEDVETAFIIPKIAKKAPEEEVVTPTLPEKPAKSRGKGIGKAKILQQTIITSKGEVLPQTSGAAAGQSIQLQPIQIQSASDDSVFDINSMPIVLSDDLLTPESIQNMPVVLSEDVLSPATAPSAIKQPEKLLANLPKKIVSALGTKQIIFKTAQPSSAPLVPAKHVGKTRVLTNLTPTPHSKLPKPGTTALLATGTTADGKQAKYMLVPPSVTPATTQVKAIKQTVVKKQPLVQSKLSSTTVVASASDPSNQIVGNKIMIVTNAQGQQTRVVLTPQQQKAFMQAQAGSKSKAIIKGTIPKALLESAAAVAAGGASGVVTKAVSAVSQGGSQIVSSQGGLLMPAVKNVKTPVQPKKSGQRTTSKPQKTILIKNQLGQTVRKIQGTDDADLDRQVAEQLEAIKASARLQQANKSPEIINYTNRQIPTATKPVIRRYSKKIEAVKTKIPISTPHVDTPKQQETSIPALAPLSPKPRIPQVQNETHQNVPKQEAVGKVDVPVPSPVNKSAEAVLQQQSKQTTVPVTSDNTRSAAPSKDTETKRPESPLRQVVIQDGLGNLTTVTVGQILAIPSETVDGQPQSYMLVTVDESGNLTPLNNDALMSLDPSLGAGGDINNMVLQVDQGQGTVAAIKPAETSASTALAPLERKKIEERLKPETPKPPLPVRQPIAAPTEQPKPHEVPLAVEQQIVIGEGVLPGDAGGQQLIVTGDPIATQKFLESLSDGSTDLANILANAEGGSVLIQADGQQILIRTNPAAQPMLGMTESTESGGNPIFAAHKPNQDILAAALANTDVFQPTDQQGIPSSLVKGLQSSQLSPGAGGPLYPMHVGSVLETSLTLNSPIMTPLEVPSTNSKKIEDEADILSQVPKNVDLPITITDPNISQTVAQQAAGFMELTLPISEIGSSGDINSPSYSYSLPCLDDSVGISQKPFSSSMPLLTEDVVEVGGSNSLDQGRIRVSRDIESAPSNFSSSFGSLPMLSEPIESSHEEIVNTSSFGDIGSLSLLTDDVIEDSGSSIGSTKLPRSSPRHNERDIVDEGLSTLGGEMCSSLSEPPPDMFDLSSITPKEEEISSDISSIPEPESLSMNSENSGEIPIQPLIVASLSDLKRSGDELDGSDEKKSRFD